MGSNGTNGNGNGKPPPSNGDGRNGSNGRFLPGNKCGKGGNVHASRVVHLQSLIHKATTDEEFLAVWRALLTEAKSGNVRAIDTVLNRLIGKPKETIKVQDDRDEAIKNARDGIRHMLKDPEIARRLDDSFLS